MELPPAKGVVMKAAVPWLAALMCAGWLTSSAQAFRIFRDLRNRGNGEVTVTDQSPAPVTAQTSVVATDAANCDASGGNHLLGGHGYLRALPGNLHGWWDKAKGCLQNVPGHAPPPPKPLVVNPYLRGPRDFFMLDDP
jgi:hypothetical protein